MRAAGGAEAMARAQEARLPSSPAPLPVLRGGDVRERGRAAMGVHYRDPNRDPSDHLTGHHHLHHRSHAQAPLAGTLDTQALSVIGRRLSSRWRSKREHS